MELVLYIKNDCIDHVPIEKAFISIPGYLGHFVRLLKTKHETLICQTYQEPEFLLRNVSVQKSKPAAVCSSIDFARSKMQQHPKKLSNGTAIWIEKNSQNIRTRIP